MHADLCLRMALKRLKFCRSWVKWKGDRGWKRDKSSCGFNENITKTFGSVIANDKVNLDIYKGEILSLLGENGSGKTTLMNMLSGIYFPDEGQIFINGKEEVIRSPKDALRLGIGMVHQHFKLIDVLSATENIILGLEGGLNIKEASRKSRRSAINTVLKWTRSRRSMICPYPRSRR